MSNHPSVPPSGSQDTSGNYTRCSIMGCPLDANQHDPTTPPPGGQPQALTAEREADLRADHQCSDVDTWCLAAGCKQDWPCATAQLLAALDEARSEVMRLQDNDSAYDLGYQRADAAAGAAIERLRQERDDARARASHFKKLATQQQTTNVEMLAPLERGLAQLEASEAEVAQLRQVLESQRVPHRYGGWERTREGYRVWCPCGWEYENTSAAIAGAAVDSHLHAPLAATLRQAQGKLGRVPAAEARREGADDE